MKQWFLNFALPLALCLSLSMPAFAADYLEAVPCKYDLVFPFSEGLAAVVIDGKFGVVDKTGTEIVAPKYDFIDKFSEGLVAFKLGNKCGYIDKTGQEIITFTDRYDIVLSFSNGLAAVCGGNKYGIIDKTGAEIVPPKYDYLHFCREGVAIVYLDKKYGVVDTTGKEIVAPVYDNSIDEFYEGVVAVNLDGKYGYIDKTGREVIAPQYAFLQEFSEGLAAVFVGDAENGKWGVIDKTGKEVIAPKYFNMKSFSEGLAAVSLGPVRQGGVLGDKWGVIDKTGREVVVPTTRYYNINDFYDGFATVFIGDLGKGKCGVIDKTGKEVVGPKYDTIGAFSSGLSGLADVSLNYQFGFIDKTGKEVIPLKYGLVRGFNEGLALVRIGDWQTGKWGAIDTTGKEIIVPKYNDIDYFYEGLAKVELNGKFGIIDITGQEVVVPMYDDMSCSWGFSDGMAAVQRNGKWGFIAVSDLTSGNPSSWAVEQVNTAIAAGLVPLSLQSKYTQAITRAEYCALAVALYEKYTGEEIIERRAFNDTKDLNVEKMAALEVVNGIGDNLFDPDAKLTREQAAAMLSRLAVAVGKPLIEQAATFADNAAISSWAIETVGQVQAAGIMGGIGNNTFAPKDPYTREQSILTMIRLFDVIKENSQNRIPVHPADVLLLGH